MDPVGAEPRHRLATIRGLLPLRGRLPRLAAVRLAPGHRLAGGGVRQLARRGSGGGQDGGRLALYLSQLEWHPASGVGCRGRVE